jgi:hypothetical protein
MKKSPLAGDFSFSNRRTPSCKPLPYCESVHFRLVLRGTDRDGSDLDLLVDVLPGTTLFDLGSLQDELESKLKVPRGKRWAEASPASALEGGGLSELGE